VSLDDASETWEEENSCTYNVMESSFVFRAMHC
jgi:hypothetical protein